MSLANPWPSMLRLGSGCGERRKRWGRGLGAGFLREPSCHP